MEKDFDRWNNFKKNLETKDFSGPVRKRDIWWCALGVNIGDEENGKGSRSERPALIVQVWSNRAVVVVPITTSIKRNRFHQVFRYHEKEYAAILSQIRMISTSRLIRRVRKLDRRTFASICEALRILLFTKNDPPRKRGSPGQRGRL